MFAGIFIEVNPVQFANALAPRFVVLSGMTISLKDEHPMNASERIESFRSVGFENNRSKKFAVFERAVADYFNVFTDCYFGNIGLSAEYCRCDFGNLFGDYVRAEFT